MKHAPTSIDWHNVDLESPYERDSFLLDPLRFSDLLLEIHCNIPEINKDAIIKQFEDDLEQRIAEARDIFTSNLANIERKAKANRKNGYAD